MAKASPSSLSVSSSSAAPAVWRQRLLACCVAVGCLWVSAFSALAQSEVEEEVPVEAADFDSGASKLSHDEAMRLLAQPLPDEPAARFLALQRHFRAAQQLDEREQQVELARQLLEAGRGRAGGEVWITTYLSAEFTWGSQGRALAACEPLLEDDRLSLPTRALVALRQTYFAAQGNDRTLLMRFWSRADSLAEKAVRQHPERSAQIAVLRLHARSEIERWQGDAAASLATLRQAVSLARREVRTARAKSKEARDAYGWLDSSLGLLTYALVRQGRVQEAIDLAQANLTLWRAGEISDGYGARWNYRLATSLNATQQYEAALAAARLSDEMLQRAGASTASHTRWLARQEMVRALIGLRRWPEADESYRSFLAAMPADLLARTRASDWRLLALLGAKNGRLDEALEQAERSHRYRSRLYGSRHPQTQEAAGVRGVVRLLRGELRQALGDYEDLFAATLDNPGGWLDLDLRGVRGYVFGIAFDEFLRYVGERALRGESVDPQLSERALQIAERSSLSVTQRALADSTARVLASTPALRTLVEQEQTQRRAVAALFSQVAGALGREDQLRREAQTDAFKALPESERKAHGERLRQVREQVKAQQTEALAARNNLNAQRAALGRQFPGYADLITPATPRAEELQRLLGPGEALLVIHSNDSATLVWLLTPEGGSSFAASRLSRHDLARRVADLRRMLDLSDHPVGREPALQPALLHALYRELFAGFGDKLSGVRSLIVATQGPLASLPMGALVTDAPQAGDVPAWLIKRLAVTQVPSAAALQSLRRVQPAAAARAMIGFADPGFASVGDKIASGAASRSAGAASAQGRAAPGRAARAVGGRYDAELGFRYGEMSPLPETRGEMQAVAAAVGADPDNDLFFGARATRRAVLETDLSDRRVVGFATHGLMPGDAPGIGKPALAMAATPDDSESPLLELDDVLNLRLNAQWVLLSACNTAAGEQGGGAMSGLVRGFFFAGARSVLATHWAVDSESSAALSTATFEAQAKDGTARAESLRQAQLALIDGRIGAGRWRHPYHWAPYALFGDPQR